MAGCDGCSDPYCGDCAAREWLDVHKGENSRQEEDSRQEEPDLDFKNPCQYPGCHGGDGSHIRECPNQSGYTDPRSLIRADMKCIQYTVSIIGSFSDEEEMRHTNNCKCEWNQ